MEEHLPEPRRRKQAVSSEVVEAGGPVVSPHDQGGGPEAVSSPLPGSASSADPVASRVVGATGPSYGCEVALSQVRSSDHGPGQGL